MYRVFSSNNGLKTKFEKASNVYSNKLSISSNKNKAGSALSCYSEGIRKPDSKSRSKKSEKYSSLKRKKRTLDNTSMILSSCGCKLKSQSLAKNFEETLKSRKVIP
jgi:hypothetical protein